ncbi:MAG: DUF2273 domain-containing protein [Collinsella sp.]|nr:DUF2273 domain-containing protein [Collinsella sp.]
MSDNRRAPKAVIEQVPETPSSKMGAPEDDQATPRRLQDATIGFFAGLGRKLWAYADVHPHTVLYGGVGLVLSVLILWLGLWHTIVIAIFVGVGAAIGQVRDGDGGFYRFLSRLFGRMR